MEMLVENFRYAQMPNIVYTYGRARVCLCVCVQVYTSFGLVYYARNVDITSIVSKLISINSSESVFFIWDTVLFDFFFLPLRSNLCMYACELLENPWIVLCAIANICNQNKWQIMKTIIRVSII